MRGSLSVSLHGKTYPLQAFLRSRKRDPRLITFSFTPVVEQESGDITDADIAVQVGTAVFLRTKVSDLRGGEEHKTHTVQIPGDRLSKVTISASNTAGVIEGITCTLERGPGKRDAILGVDIALGVLSFRPVSGRWLIMVDDRFEGPPAPEA